MRTLLLNPWMSPHKIITWERAVVLVVLNKVDVIEHYDEEVRAQHFALQTPSIVRLKKSRRSTKNVVRFSRINVYTRDDFRCQYCGDKRSMRELNYDHVIPRVRGGKTTWENIVTSCYACNDKKGSRTPEEAGMKLRKKPLVPKSLSVTPPFRIRVSDVPTSWLPYCSAIDSETA